MNYVSCDICVYHLGLFVFFPGVFLGSRVSEACPEACPVTTDLTMRVNVRTTTTIHCRPSCRKLRKAINNNDKQMATFIICRIR